MKKGWIIRDLITGKYLTGGNEKWTDNVKDAMFFRFDPTELELTSLNPVEVIRVINFIT